eukprot:TRINITY_DN22377_c0_g1_i1.p1 TRINITY_DN22377_c0_g1~~TRINITY_DN22377_c0_g1_i1.p1  ORF type:complete len:277 (-),score=71.38 TRINITY_DN22377_c0_g1_i1:68-898(-)
MSDMFASQRSMELSMLHPSSPERTAHRLHLQRLKHPCLAKLGGRMASFFDEPTSRDRYPPFGSKSPREKSKSPRYQGALHQLWDEPKAQEKFTQTWRASLPQNERMLRFALDEKVPGSPDPPSMRNTPRSSPPEPEEKLRRRREEQAAKIEKLLRKVGPSKEQEAPVVLAAKQRLERLRTDPKADEGSKDKEAQMQEVKAKAKEGLLAAKRDGSLERIAADMEAASASKGVTDLPAEAPVQLQDVKVKAKEGLLAAKRDGSLERIAADMEASMTQG